MRLAGDDIEDARLLARTIAEDTGSQLVEDSLDLGTCEGAGTIGLELLERGPQFDTLVIALGGGALASGVGLVAKCLAPQVEVVAVQPTGAPAMALSWRRGSVVETDTIDTIADGVAGRCPIPEVLDDLLVVVDDVVLVGRRASWPACDCSTGTPDSSSSPRRLSGSPPCWRTANASPAGGWPRSSAAAT